MLSKCNPLTKKKKSNSPHNLWELAFAHGVSKGWSVNKCQAYADLAYNKAMALEAYHAK